VIGSIANNYSLQSSEEMTEAESEIDDYCCTLRIITIKREEEDKVKIDVKIE